MKRKTLKDIQDCKKEPRVIVKEERVKLSHEGGDHPPQGQDGTVFLGPKSCTPGTTIRKCWKGG